MVAVKRVKTSQPLRSNLGKQLALDLEVLVAEMAHYDKFMAEWHSADAADRQAAKSAVRSRMAALKASWPAA